MLIFQKHSLELKDSPKNRANKSHTSSYLRKLYFLLKHKEEEVCESSLKLKLTRIKKSHMSCSITIKINY